MNWRIDEREGVVVVKMSSNRLNIMNDTFFVDLNNAFDMIESDHKDKPVVLTSVGNVFSAGVDLKHCLPIFESGDKKKIQVWFDQFRDSILRVFTFDQPLIAAINGHAIAGGLILALCCDIRFAINTSAKFGLNEITIGFPLPRVFAEIIKHAIGARRAEEMLFRGNLYNVDEALKLGIFHNVTIQSNLMDMALSYASEFNGSNIHSYSIAKKAMRDEVLDRICGLSKVTDKQIVDSLASNETVSSLRNVLEGLKSQKGNSA